MGIVAGNIIVGGGEAEVSPPIAKESRVITSMEEINKLRASGGDIVINQEEPQYPTDGTPFTKKKSQYMSDMLNPDL